MLYYCSVFHYSTSDLSDHLKGFSFPKGNTLICVSKDTFCSPKGIHVSQRLYFFWFVSRRTIFGPRKGINSFPRENFITPKRFRNCQILYDPVHGAFRNAKLDKTMGYHGRLTQDLLCISDSGNVFLKKILSAPSDA